jgi:hypothetical protein
VNQGHRTRTAVVLAAVGVAILAVLFFFPFHKKEKGFLALNDLNQLLTCADASNSDILGTMLITSLDNGKTLSVAADGKIFSLVYAGSTIVDDLYRNKVGQQLQFDGEITHSGIFGDVGGHCS